MPKAKVKKHARRLFAKAIKNAAGEALSTSGVVRDLKDLGWQIGPAFAAYAAVRFSGRLARRLAARWPFLARHLTPMANLTAFGGLWFMTEKIDSLKKVQGPILIGAGVATVQGLIQSYLPGLMGLLDGSSPLIQQAVATTPPSQPMPEYIEVPMIGPGPGEPVEVEAPSMPGGRSLPTEGWGATPN